MPEEQALDYMSSFLTDINTKIRDLEERQRLLRERVLLIGQNLIETKETLQKDVLALKLKAEDTTSELKKIKQAILSMSEEIEKKARKSELELLAKQAKMFQPLEFARIDDVKKMIGGK